MKFSAILVIIIVIVLAFTLFLNNILPSANVDLLESAPTTTTFNFENLETGTNPNSNITLIEFGDFKCPFCGQMHPDIKKLLTSYPDINYVYKHFPADDEASARAALASECAREQNKFIEYLDILFTRQLDFSYPKLQTFAAELGLDLNDFVDCMEDFRGLDRIDNDIKEGKLNGVKGTPTIFLNSRKMEGIQPLSNLQLIVEQELIRAR